MLLVNYWNSTVCTLEIMPNGRLGRLMATYDPKGGKEMKASADKHVNHSRNDAAAQAERQGDPHSHAIVLEPTMGNIAYVPDLGMDLVRQFHFDEETGVVTPCGEIVSGVKSDGRALGPRYITFAKQAPFCYVVNELSSQVAVFEYHPEVAADIARACSTAATHEAKAAAMAGARPTLTLIQTVSTIPEAFPRDMNTCGRTTIHPTGDYVVTSNRGHDSVAVHRIHKASGITGGHLPHTRRDTAPLPVRPVRAVAHHREPGLGHLRYLQLQLLHWLGTTTLTQERKEIHSPQAARSSACSSSCSSSSSS